MFNPFEPHTHLTSTSTPSHLGFSREGSTSGLPAQERFHKPRDQSYSLDAIVHESGVKAQSLQYSTTSADTLLERVSEDRPSSPSAKADTAPAIFTRTTISDPDIQKFFNQGEQAVLQTLVAERGQPLLLSELSRRVQLTTGTVQNNICTINRRLEEANASKILTIIRKGKNESAYLLESTHPHIIRSSTERQYELMQNSFCWKGQDQKLHEIALQDYESSILQHVIDQREQGVTKDEMQKLIGSDIAVRAIVNKLNRHLKHSTIMIDNAALPPRSAFYVRARFAPH